LNFFIVANDDAGYYLILKGRKSVKTAKSWLTSPPMVAKNGQICSLRFFYYLYGDDDQLGTIKVYTKFTSQLNEYPLYEKTGSVGQFWDRAEVGVNNSEPFSFVIEGTAGTGLEGDIAIDDASLSPGCEFYNHVLPTAQPTHPTVYLCSSDQFKCANGECIDSKLYCGTFRLSSNE